MSTASTGTPRIAVVGGGIGGLSAAAFMHRAGLDVTVYEQAPALGEVGAGLVVSPNAIRMIRRLGHVEAFLDKAVALDVGWEFRRWQDGRVLSSEQMAGRCEDLYGERSYVTHRADLVDALRCAVPEHLVRLGTRCIDVTDRGDTFELAFADGSTAVADVVVGADGIHSVVRNHITEPSPAEYSGMCAYRALVPAADAPEHFRRPVQTLWLGPDHHLVHYPISGGNYINIVAFAPAGDVVDESWSATATVDELLAEFAGWDSRLIELIARADTPGRWALLDRAPLQNWSKGRMTLLGDAAHPMFPFYAQGAAQSIEDAAALAQSLSDNPTDPETALAHYEAVRRPRTTRIQELSRNRKEINHLPDGPEQTARDEALAGSDALADSAWLYGYDAELEAGSAVAQ
ncbi:FAD-dependent monooxygenase [Rhodococcus sp. NPDC057297]|uniref:FAD-dependent monooxygenase n=1 Tax=Rhodococcus sp. NPDC057297 TaxID=3346090 RepID=UPI00364411F2